MNSVFIHEINEGLKDLFKSFKNAKVYGLAQSVIRKQGTREDLLPCVISKDGESTYIGIDDVYSIIAYHKTSSMSFKLVGSPSGDSIGDIQNTYQNTLYVYLDTKKTKLLPEELILYIQANFPDWLIIKPYLTVRTSFTNVILNTQVVYASEYKVTDSKLSAHQHLFAINYNIESTHKKGCFDKCPEEHNN